MPYVNAKEMLTAAKKGHYAVGHFNLNNMESVRAFLLAAEELKSPIILGVSGGTANKAFVTGDAARHKSNGAAFALSDDFKFTRTRPDAFSVFENVGAVKVAAGAKLTADGDGIGAISSISVDASGTGRARSTVLR